jgi:hypothetical protein
MPDSDVRTFLERHLQGIFDYDLEHYKATTAEDLGLYEWYIVPQRIDGIPFHEFLMREAALANATALTGTGLMDNSARPGQERPRVRFDLANFREQRYGDTAIASYTLLVSTSTGAGVTVTSYNESRVMVRFADGWKVVHVHKSPAYKSPLEAPRQPGG